MLGEKHSLEHDFPELKDKIKTLLANNDHFAEQNKRYNALDNVICPCRSISSPQSRARSR